MSELDNLRASIDDIDAQLVALFEKRMDVTRRVGEWKKENGIPVLDAGREKEVLSKKEAMISNPYLRTDVKDFFSAIMAISRRQQRGLISDSSGETAFEKFKSDIDNARDMVKNPRVLYQGIAGAYADEAAEKFFRSGADIKCCATWSEVFENIKNETADYGVVPIENNSTGSINAVYDLLAEYGFYVVGEQTVKVDHCLCALPGAKLSDIKNVYSHEQGLSQCEEYIAKHGFAKNAALNTAIAAKIVAEGGDRHSAAICSLHAAKLYGLDIIAEGINTSSENYTRFFVVSKYAELREGCNKISLLFTLPNEAGALHKIMSVFATHSINLLKLESRPILGKGWEYRFFADIEGTLAGGTMNSALYELLENTLSLRILGSYVKGA